MQNFLYKTIATFFFLGYSPKFPGTVGTMGAAIIYSVLFFFNVAHFHILIICMLAASFLNILIGKWAEEYYQTKDPQKVVIDEVAGYFMTVAWFTPSWTVMIAGFIAFRIFDGTKPYPISKIEKLPHGVGVLCDDLAAGVYSAASLYLLNYLLSMNNIMLF